MRWDCFMQNDLHNTSPKKRQRCPFLYFQPESAIMELKKWSYKPCSKQQMCSHPCFLPESAIFWTENICEVMHVCPNIRFKQSLWCERRNILALVEVFLPYRDSFYHFSVLWKIQILNILLFENIDCLTVETNNAIFASWGLILFESTN